MPEIGRRPGDNVTGEQYTLDLGVEPDLGNLLSNLQVANDLLDQSEQKFRAISQAVGMTTQQLTQATRQTAMLAAQADRLRNTYQAIASAGAAMAGIGAAAAGGPGGVPIVPGQAAFSGVPGTIPAMGPALAMPGGVLLGPGGAPIHGESIPEFELPPPPQPFHDLGTFFFGQQVLSALAQQHTAPTGWISRVKKAWRAAKQTPGFGQGLAVAQEAAEGVEETRGGLLARLGASRFGVGVAGLLGGMGAKLGPWGAAAYTGYRLWGGAQAGARRLAGMTGGEAGWAGMLGEGEVPGYLGLRARAIAMGMLHPGVPYGEIQDRTLAQGYIGGTFGEARDYMFEAYKRGMGEMIDHIDLYSEVVDRAGGSTQNLVRAMDQMRTVARSTNANLTAMAKNYKENVEYLVAMGVAGSSAAYGAQISSTAWAQSTFGRMNPALRTVGGYDLSLGGGNVLLRAQVASMAGVGFGQLEQQGYLNPQFGANLPVMSEEAAARILESMGFSADMTPSEIAAADPLLMLKAPLLQQLLPPGTNIANPDEVYQGIATTLDRPTAREQREAKAALEGESAAQALRGVEVGGRTKYESLWSAGVDTATRARTYVERLGGSLGEGTIGGWYSNLLTKRGAKTIPLLEEILQSGAADRTYIRYKDEKANEWRGLSLTAFLQQVPNASELLRSGEVEVATISLDEQEMLRKATERDEFGRIKPSEERRDIMSEVWRRASPGWAYSGGRTEDTPGAAGEAEIAATVAIDFKSIQLLAQAIADGVR